MVVVVSVALVMLVSMLVESLVTVVLVEMLVSRGQASLMLLSKGGTPASWGRVYAAGLGC